MLSNDSRRNSIQNFAPLRPYLFSFSDSVSSLSTNDQQSLGTCSFQDEDTMSVTTMSYGSHHDEILAPSSSTVTAAAVATTIATIKSIINRIKYHYNENYDDTIIKSSKVSSVLGISTESIVSFVSGFILCIMFDVTLYRMKRHATTTNSSVELLFHNQYSFINLYIIVYTFLSYLYRKTVYKLQKYIIRESTTIHTGDSIYNLLLSLPDIFNLGLACFITTRQVYYAFHLLASSVVILSLFVACCDLWIYRMNILSNQDETIEFNTSSLSTPKSRHHHRHENVIIDMRPTTSSMVSNNTRELKTRKKAKRTVRSSIEKNDIKGSNNSFWFSMV